MQEFVPGDSSNYGALIGRADLSDEQMVDAVRRRLLANGRDPEAAEATIAAAQSGDEKAGSLVRTISVPAPVSKLSMPTQRLTREGHTRFGLAYSRLSALVRN